MKITDILSKKAIIADGKFGSKRQLLEKLAGMAEEETGADSRTLFDALLDKQHAILKTAKQFVGTKGRLSYITCSLTVDENDNQVNRFLDENPGFVIEKRVQYSPARTHTDGLYIAVMRRV